MRDITNHKMRLTTTAITRKIMLILGLMETAMTKAPATKKGERSTNRMNMATPTCV